MIKFPHKEKNPFKLDLIPMINVVFLLLIFFLLTGVIQKKDDTDVSIPTSFFGKKKVKLKKRLQ